MRWFWTYLDLYLYRDVYSVFIRTHVGIHKILWDWIRVMSTSLIVPKILLQPSRLLSVKNEYNCRHKCYAVTYKYRRAEKDRDLQKVGETGRHETGKDQR